MASNSRKATKVKIYFDGELDTDQEYNAVSITRAHSSRHLDTAIIARDLSKVDNPLQDIHLRESVGGEIEITFSEHDGSNERVVHWGKLSKLKFADSAAGPSEQLVSRMELFHFGNPIIGRTEYSPANDQAINLELPLIFNPQIDSIIYGNRYPLFRGSQEWFLDVESVRTHDTQRRANLQVDHQPDQWKLSQVIFYLTRAGNPNGTYVGNPSQDYLISVFNDDNDKVRHLHLPDGLFLPEALDHVLRPFGYSWYVSFDSRGSRSLKFFRRGVGTKKVALQMARRGETYDRSTCNCKSYDLEFDIASIANTIIGLGSHHEYEITVPLQRAWDKSLDTTDEANLSNSTTQTAFEQYRDVWRKFVIGDINDYSTLASHWTHLDLGDLAGEDATDILGQPLATPLTDAFRVERRRHLHPCLTCDDDGAPKGKEHHGIILEYLHPDGDYRLVGAEDNAEFRILHNEAGIYFSGEKPPSFLRDLGDNAVLRVTCTVRMDSRVRYTAERQSNSVNGDTVPVVLDLSHRFHFKKIDNSSQFYSKVNDGTLKSLAIDDREALKAYTVQIRDAYNVAEVSGQALLDGLDNPQFDLGASVLAVQGRGVSFEGRGGSQNSADQVFPQIVGITYDVLAQETTLMLQQFKASHLRAVPGGLS